MSYVRLLASRTTPWRMLSLAARRTGGSILVLRRPTPGFRRDADIINGIADRSEKAASSLARLPDCHGFSALIVAVISRVAIISLVAIVTPVAAIASVTLVALIAVVVPAAIVAAISVTIITTVPVGRL